LAGHAGKPGGNSTMFSQGAPLPLREAVPQGKARPIA
jgi:hypothetical protein